MLSSVFSRRKGFQRKLNNLTQLTHTLRNQQSPPSPASFESPEIVDITIAASHHEQQASEAVAPHREVSPSPQVQLNLRRSDSLSDWFPSNLLRSEPMAPPERNASLAASSLKSASSGSMRSLPQQRGRSASNAREPFDNAPDDVIIIEAEVRYTRSALP